MFLQTKDATVNDNHELLVDGVSTIELKKKYGTPLYIMSEGHLREQLALVKEKFMDKYGNALTLFASKSFRCVAMYKLVK